MDTIEARPDRPFNLGEAITQPFRIGGWKQTLGLAFGGILILILGYIIMGVMFGGAIMGFATSGALEGGVPSGGAIAGFAFAYIGLLILSIAMMAVLESGMHRKVLRGEGGAFPFRVGRDESRVFLAILGVYGVFIVGMIVAGIVAAILGYIITMLPGAIGGMLMAVLMIAFYAAIIFFAVRLAPAGALTILRRKTHVLAALKVTQGRFWWMFLSYLVTVIGGYIVLLAVVFLTMGGVMGGAMGAAMSGGSESEVAAAMTQAMSGGSLVTLIIGALLLLPLMILWQFTFTGISSYVVKTWNRGESEYSTFD